MHQNICIFSNFTLDFTTCHKIQYKVVLLNIESDVFEYLIHKTLFWFPINMLSSAKCGVTN